MVHFGIQASQFLSFFRMKDLTVRGDVHGLSRFTVPWLPGHPIPSWSTTAQRSLLFHSAGWRVILRTDPAFTSIRKVYSLMRCMCFLQGAYPG